MAVFTSADISAKPLVDRTPFDHHKTPQAVLARDRVRFEGEALAVVVATSQEIAEDAAELVDVTYDDLPFLMNVPAALAMDAPVLHEHLDSNEIYRERHAFGDVAGAFAAANRVFRRSFATNRLSASPLETRGCVASFDPSMAQLTLWSPTQSPDLLKLTLSDSMGLPSHAVRVIVPDVGGAFGAKIPTAPEEVVVCCVSRVLGRPVRWIESRSEYLAAGTHAKEQLIDLEVAISAEARILAMCGTFTGDAGAYSFNSLGGLIEPQRAASMMTSAYDIAACEYEIAVVLTNKSPIAPYRGVGFTSAQTARELLFDDIARELTIDPAEFRLRNMIPDGAFPYECVTGAVYDSGAYQEGMRTALKRVDYPRLRTEQRRLRGEGRYIGIGISPFVEHTAKGSEISTQTGWPFSSHDNATVTVDPNGQVHVAVSAVAQGQGHETAMAQIAADAVGVSPSEVYVAAGDTERTPFGMGTWGSRSAVIAGGAMILAARDVRLKLLEVGSVLLEVDADDLSLHDSRVEVRGTAERGMPLAEVAAAAYWNKNVRAVVPDPYPSSTRFYDPKAAYTGGCLVTVVEVDVETGAVEVQRFVAVEGCGTMINPAIVAGQVHGGVGQAIGSALCEGHRYGPEGRLLTTTFAGYRMPRSTEVPRIEVEHQPSPSPVTIGGFKGIGEGSMVGGPAAVAAAVMDAIAHFQPRDVELPLTPEHVLRAMGRL